MKKLNKKGFTIVELVIVIAVIAILAAVLIPTFSGVVDKANQSAALQKARNEYTEVMAKDLADGKLDGKEGTSVNYIGVTGNFSATEASGSWYVDTANNTYILKEVVYNTKYLVSFNGTSWSVTTKTA